MDAIEARNRKRRENPRLQISRAIAAAACLLCAGAPARADYPIASHRYLADPAALVEDGRIYLYCSNDDENAVEGDYAMQSIVCISSSDLKNWTDHGIVFEVPAGAAWASRAWAPAAVARNGTYYLYFGNSGSGIGVASAPSPLGPFQDAVGGYLINPSTPGAPGPNMWYFDPYVFIDDDAQAYLYFGGNGESNARVIKLNSDMISVDGAARSITAPGFFEAAWMHKIDGVYYFSYSTNPANGLRIDYMASDDPMSGFEYKGVVAGQPPSNNNNNHHGIIPFQGSWYHVYHNRYVAAQAGIATGFRRNLGIERLQINNDGSIEPVSYTRDGVAQAGALDPYARVEAETFADQSGVETTRGDGGGMALSELSGGDWITLRGVDFGEGARSFAARAAGLSGGAIELRLDARDGTLIGVCEVAGEEEGWPEVSAEIDATLAKGARDLYFVFVGEGEALFELDWWQFEPSVPTETFAAWIGAAFPDQSDPEVLGPEADPDEDGMPNLLEYYAGTYPNFPDRLALDAAVDADGRLNVSYRRSQSVEGIVATVERSTDLALWEPAVPAPVMTGAEGAHRVEFGVAPIESDRVFARIAVAFAPGEGAVEE